MPLTELQIKNFKPRQTLYRISDGNGLALDVSPSGGKLWRWRYRYNGKEQILALGQYPAISLAQARKLRDDAKKLLAEGKNPSREKKAQKLRAMHEGENTFEKVARRCLEIKQANMNEKYRVQCLARMEQHVFPFMGDLPIAEITIPDVVRVIEKIGQRGTVETAKRMKQLISQTFRFAAQRGLCDHNPAADLRGILPTQEKKHHASVSMAEVPALLQAIEARKPDFSKYALKLLALTFVRTSELIGAKWEEIDFDRAEWHIPKERMKARRPHIVPLSKQATAIFKDLYRITGEKPYVFHSPSSKSKHISNGTVLMALRRMGYGGSMTGHGWRSIASSILYERGYKPEAIEMQLAHQDQNEVRSAYNYKATYMLERKKMMQDYADILDGMAQGKTVSVAYFGKKRVSS